MGLPQGSVNRAGSTVPDRALDLPPRPPHSPATMISYAQNFEDVLLWRFLKDVPDGTYVDVGAHHPELDSVTAWFYGQGWSGINVEPIPYLIERIAAARPRDQNLAVAAGASAGEVVLHVFPESPGLSTLNANIAAASSRRSEAITVPLLPLRDILAPIAGKPIHFLKIDVEGAERDVLAGMDFDRFRPWVVVIEAAPADNAGPTGPAWDDLILPHGYHEVWWDGLNRYFVADEQAERDARLAKPPNVFDCFELASTVRERTARIASETAQGELRAAIAQRDDRVAALDAMVLVRDARIGELDHSIAEKDDRIRERDATILEQDTVIQNERLHASAALAQLQRELGFKQDVIAIVQEDAARWRAGAEAAAGRAAALEQSASWKVTAPMRWSTTILRRTFGVLRPGSSRSPIA